jgi:hypothetical protein
MTTTASKTRRTRGSERFWREIEQYLAFWAIARGD